MDGGDGPFTVGSCIEVVDLKTQVFVPRDAELLEALGGGEEGD